MNNKNEINQDLIFFKNDILLDLRKVEERFNNKLTEQSIISSDQYDSFDKKLSELSERITKVQSLILDNNDLTDKIKTFVRFQTRAEDNFNRINSKIYSFQKENGTFAINIERMINENLKYPGVIGRNGKFLNFRYFIDYTMKNFNDLNNFRDEVRDYNFNEFKKKINKDISDFRAAISENNLNSIRLISKNINEFDIKLRDIIERINKSMKENEEEIKNNINKYFSEIQIKIESLENNLNEKFKEQLKDIENLKDIKSELITHFNESKSFLEKIKSSNNNIIDNNTKETNDNYIKNENQNNNKFDCNNNNNINISENYKKDEDQNNINNCQELNNSSIENKEEAKEYDTNYNTISKENRGSNYSISNIANIKLNKVILPEYIDKRIMNIGSSNLLSDNKKRILISNDLSSTITQNRMHLKDNINNMRKSSFDNSKISRQRKNKNINISHSVRFTNRKVEVKNQKIMNSLIIIKPKSKNNIYQNLNGLKREKKYNLSFDKEKNIIIDEKAHVGFGKTFNLKNKIKELILINSRNLKKNRKIQI